MAINNNNIGDYVKYYLERPENLPIFLQNIPIGNWNVSGVTDMHGLFQGRDDDTFNEPLNNWNVDNVTDMSMMFFNCQRFDQPLNSWNVSNVTDMRMMFFNCNRFNRPLNSWIINPGTNVYYMFENCNELLDINRPLLPLPPPPPPLLSLPPALPPMPAICNNQDIPFVDSRPDLDDTCPISQEQIESNECVAVIDDDIEKVVGKKEMVRRMYKPQHLLKWANERHTNPVTRKAINDNNNITYRRYRTPSATASQWAQSADQGVQSLTYDFVSGSLQIC
jgi:surface protein